MTYSSQFRQKILTKLDEGLTIREVADQFEISPTTITHWKKGRTPTHTRKRPSLKIDEGALRRDVELHPESYHYERAKRFNCSAWAIVKALRRLGISQKKDTKTSKS